MFDIIINPKGGKGKSLKALKTVEKLLKEHGEEYKLHNTEYAGHATVLARELSAKPDTKLIVMGGDGSFNEVLNGIVNFDNVTLGIVACGTGNDFIRASKHPKKVKDAVELILKGNVGYIDYIDVGTRRCLNVAGAGMDVDVLIRYANMKAFHGKVKYYASLFDTLAHVKWHKLRLTIDGKTNIVRIAPTSDPATFSLNFIFCTPIYCADISANHALISASFSAPHAMSAVSSFALVSRPSFCSTPSTEGSK